MNRVYLEWTPKYLKKKPVVISSQTGRVEWVVRVVRVVFLNLVSSQNGNKISKSCAPLRGCWTSVI